MREYRENREKGLAQHIAILNSPVYAKHRRKELEEKRSELETIRLLRTEAENDRTKTNDRTTVVLRKASNEALLSSS